MNTRTFSEDYARGISAEGRNQSKISNWLKKTVEKTTDPYHPMDFTVKDDSSHYAEHKDRSTFSYATLRDKCGGTVFIGKNKIDYLKKNNATATFFFELKDGIYKATYDEEFHTYPTRFHERGRPDKRNDGSWIVEIPLTKLTKLLE